MQKAAKERLRVPGFDSTARRNLLDTRLCDLGLSLQARDTATLRVIHAIAQLRSELLDAELVFLKPHFYIGDEWFCAEGTTSISIPFYLFRDDLLALENDVMGFAEGDTHDELMKLLRHECGHCFDHAYGIANTPAWKKIFGDAPGFYDPDCYIAQENSDAFVTNLANHYGQSHPDEDFAETFAVWLRGSHYWKKRYDPGKLARTKLDEIQRIATRVRQSHPKFQGASRMAAANLLRGTLRQHYERRIASSYLEMHGSWTSVLPTF